MQGTRLQCPSWENSPGVGKSKPLQYSLPGESHGQRSLAGNSPWGLQRVQYNLVTKQQQCLQKGAMTYLVSSVSSVTQSCPALCNPMDCSIPGLPVHHQLLEFTQTHINRVSDAIQPSHPLLLHSPPTFNLSQHQGLFQ